MPFIVTLALGLKPKGCSAPAVLHVEKLPPFSVAHDWAAVAAFLTSLCAVASRALSRWARKAGLAMVARIAMMTTDDILPNLQTRLSSVFTLC